MNCMTIARGSTFDFTINLPDGYDISDAKAVWVTFVQYDKEVFTLKYPNDLDVEQNHIYCHLDQNDTLQFLGNGSAKLQVRILTAEDEAIVQEPPTEIHVLDILKDGVIE